MKDVPVPSEEPPVEASYQLIVPALAVASRFTVPASQREPGVVPVMLGIAFTVNTDAVDVAGEQAVVPTITRYL